MEKITKDSIKVIISNDEIKIRSKKRRRRILLPEFAPFCKNRAGYGNFNTV